LETERDWAWMELVLVAFVPPVSIEDHVAEPSNLMPSQEYLSSIKH
jgi:hypothetical protein